MSNFGVCFNYLSLIVFHSSFQILCAPELGNDFYLNLLDWSSENMIAVGLNTRAYLCNASNGNGTLVIFYFCIYFKSGHKK